MIITTIRNLFLSLLMCVGTVAFADTDAATVGEVVIATFNLEQELLTAKTSAAIEAAKTKALAAGVPFKTVEAAVASRTTKSPAASSATVVSRPKPKSTVISTQVRPTVGGSTRLKHRGIPAGSTNIGDTGSTYNDGAAAANNITNINNILLLQ